MSNQDHNTQNNSQKDQSSNKATNGNIKGSTQNQDYEYLKKELEETQTKLKEMMQISQQALADLQNFKRRTEEEKTAFAVYANSELLVALLPAIDNMNRALQHEPKNEEWGKGITQTVKQLLQALEKWGLATIPTIGQHFNPKYHEALLEGSGEKDIIMAELEKGYMLGDKVLKPARVQVGNGEEKKDTAKKTTE